MIKIITDIQKEWIQDILDGKINKEDNPRKYSAYMKRIQNRTDHMFEHLLWMAKNCPDILRNEEREFDDPSLERHSRLKSLLRVCSEINPFTEDPSILRILSQLLPSQYGIEIFKKPIRAPKPLDVYQCNACGAQFEPVSIKDGKCPNCQSDNYELMD